MAIIGKIPGLTVLENLVKDLPPEDAALLLSTRGEEPLASDPRLDRRR